MHHNKKIILLVEDEAINARLNRRILKKNGFEVIHADSGEKAIEIANSIYINLILMDIDLGDGMDGTNAAEIILTEHDIPLIFLSSHTDPEIVKRTEGITSYGYIVKNSGETVLIASMKMAFRFFEVKKEKDRHEKKLLKSEERYRMIFENTGTSMFLVESDMTVTMVNDEFERRFGYSKDEVIGRKKFPEFIHADSLKFMLEQHRIRRGNDKSALQSYEFKYVTKQGEVRDGLIFVSFIPKTDESIVSVTDITELKNAENIIIIKNNELSRLNGELAAANEELNASMEEFEAANEELIHANVLLEERESDLKFIFNTLSTGILIDSDRGIKVFNRSILEITGYSEEEIRNNTLVSIIHPDDCELFLKQYNRIIDGVKNEVSGSCRIITPQNREKWIGVKSNMIKWQGKKVLFSFINDITARKEAEFALSRRLVLEKIISTISLMAMTMRDLNNFMDKSLSVIGKDLELSRVYIFEHDHITEMMNNVYEWCSSGVIPQKENLQNIPADLIPWWISTLKKGNDICYTDIEEIPESATVDMLKSQNVVSVLVVPLFVNNLYSGFIGFDDCLKKHEWSFEDREMLSSISRIISGFIERKESENKIQSLLSEKELLLKETHHRIKNNMNAVYGMLYMQAEDLNDTDSAIILKDAASRVSSMMVLYDKLYRSDDHIEIDISDYLTSLINKIFTVYNSPVPIERKVEIESFTLSSKILSPLGVIINELISNSMKYAFPNREKGIIEVRVYKECGEVKIVYYDNGVGLPESISPENSTGFGMELMSMLISQINGVVDIRRENGTAFTITFQASG